MLKPYHKRAELVNLMITEDKSDIEDIDENFPAIDSEPTLFDFEIKESSSLNDKLNEQQIQEFHDLPLKFSKIFSNKPGKTHLRENKYQPYQLSQIRHIAYQLCYSVKALHDNMIIHTDLKPENICLVSSDFTYGIRATRQQTYRKPISTNIRLIDFGSAVDFFDDKDIMIQTRYYRAPEVVFELQWNQEVDVWSIGCILFELYTGECLFTAHDDDEHYQVMLDVLGPFPDLYLSTKLARKHKVTYPEHKKRNRKPLRGALPPAGCHSPTPKEDCMAILACFTRDNVDTAS
ncbi:Serine/threonine-protein kinase Doa [Araneus ventricosus]|uniref:Serine/threonine-protein kinase Doa n=1 Tax=Araneus ventricosus TaxID=182803 RepID=A0A4Y2JVQ6_ARAVE|nr:Serine/threonine-protein kinase Doa [Araneus ventricosus]